MAEKKQHPKERIGAEDGAVDASQSQKPDETTLGESWDDAALPPRTYIAAIRRDKAEVGARLRRVERKNTDGGAGIH